MKSIEIKDLKIRYQTLVPTSIGKKLLRFNAVENKVFEAIKGINLSIESGDVIGLIGSNGSGKTTLLRCIAGIFTPDEGTVELFGNNVSLLSIGVGFDPQMTGYDNIFLSGLLMGFTKEQIRQKIEEIIEFSELGDFINMPVKTYSSGMHSRLAFSITAVMLEPSPGAAKSTDTVIDFPSAATSALLSVVAAVTTDAVASADLNFTSQFPDCVAAVPLIGNA